MILTVRSQSELAPYLSSIEANAAKTVEAISTSIAAAPSPTEVLRRMKFEQVGFHPTGGHPLNLIEQINQTFTFLVALKATEWLLEHHPEAGGFRLAPGAHAATDFDIMSVAPDVVGAETFAAVNPANNRKLVRDLTKLSGCGCRHRYAFFSAPGFPSGRIQQLEQDPSIQVHCIEI